jgi:uncharacterized protein (TIGR03663 family)
VIAEGNRRESAWLCAGLIVAVGVGALLFRAPRLDQRPMHTDEAVHAAKAGILIETGRYEYDPHEYHGPTIYYFALPFVWGSGANRLADTSEWMFRIVPVLFGGGLVLLLLLIADGIGWWAAVCAGVLTAVSPAMVFYSRYYIQEMAFVFFTFAAIAGGWRYARSKRLGWALLTGAGLGLMYATKETSVLAWAAMAGGLLLTALWSRWREGAPIGLRGHVKGWHWVAAVMLGALVAAAFLSGFFTNPRGALDGVLTLLDYVKRADGAGIHDHPWYYYFQILLGLEPTRGPRWHERLIVFMAVAGGLFALRKNRDGGADASLARFLLFYTLLLIAAYAIIPYKTPWCMLGFLHGMILLAGFGVVALVRLFTNLRARVIFLAVVALATYQLGMKACLASFQFYADTRNPYVYGHTSTDMLHLVARIEDIAEVAPDGRDMLIKVITPDSWPLPWYLRKYGRVGYWPEPTDDVDAPIIITSVDLQPEVERRLRGEYQTECYGQRPEVLMTVFIRRDLWEAFMKTRIALEGIMVGGASFVRSPWCTWPPSFGMVEFLLPPRPLRSS